MSGTKRKKFYGFGYLNFFAPKTISLVNYSWRPQSKFDFSGFFGPYSLHCSTLSKSIRTRQTIMESHRMLAFSFQRESNHFFVHRPFECLIKYAWIQNHTWWANCRTNKCMAFTADQPGGPQMLNFTCHTIANILRSLSLFNISINSAMSMPIPNYTR